jgi:hypothetical protein
MRTVLASEIVTATLHLAIDRQGDPFLWPVRLPDVNGKDNRYWRSARIAVAHCETHWCRVVANQSAGAYHVFRTENAQVFGEPEWPELAFREILRLAFQQQLIDAPDYPVVRRLVGLA